jgi:predicted O-methyltransferase YrrM
MDLKEVTKKAMELKALQKPSELLGLLEYLRREPPHVVVEIGTARGGTLSALCQIARPDALIISIDIPGGAFGGGFTEDEAKGFMAYKQEGQALHFLRKDSHLKATRDKLLKILGEIKIDFLMIDGDHTYEGVKKDWELYSPLVREGGVIAFHDICFHPYVPECQVDRFWDEVKARHCWHEVIDKSDITWGGIGIIEKRKPAIVPDTGILLDISRGEIQEGFTRMTHNKESFPWPYADNSVHICVGSHVIEHIRPWLIWEFFNELWRIMKPNGQVALSTPFAGSPGWFGDPSHCTSFNHISFSYLDPEFGTYLIHKPRPWRIEKGHPVYKTDGNLECMLRPRKGGL